MGWASYMEDNLERVDSYFSRSDNANYSPREVIKVVLTVNVEQDQIITGNTQAQHEPLVIPITDSRDKIFRCLKYLFSKDIVALTSKLINLHSLEEFSGREVTSINELRNQLETGKRELKSQLEHNNRELQLEIARERNELSQLLRKILSQLDDEKKSNHALQAELRQTQRDLIDLHLDRHEQADVILKGRTKQTLQPGVYYDHSFGNLYIVPGWSSNDKGKLVKLIQKTQYKYSRIVEISPASESTELGSAIDRISHKAGCNVPVTSLVAVLSKSK